MKNWVSGIPYEVQFWDARMGNKDVVRRMLEWSNYNKEINLPCFDVRQYVLSHPNPKILDVGCGMSYCVGNFVDGQAVDIMYVDPLASFYNKILKKYVINLPEITFGAIEYLSCQFLNYADIITVQNALDHCSNPLKGIKECLRSLKIGGVLYLKHTPNEAEREQYRGFHQFNIENADNDIRLWNKSQDIRLKDEIGAYTEIDVYEKGGYVIAVITKTSDLELDYQSDVKTLLNSTMEVIEQYDSTSYGIRYHTKKIFFAIAQRFLNLFSWDTRQKLKNLIN